MPYHQTKMLNITREMLEADYKELNNLTKIANKYNVAKGTIIYYFKKLQIPYALKVRNYGCDEYFFESDNELSFYWAGFLAADGCISDRKTDNSKTLYLQLAEKDLDHLLLFKEHIKSNHPIKNKLVKNSLLNPNWNDQVICRIGIGSLPLTKELERFNILPRKTKTYDFPKWLTNHFMRGYFDGDGCLYRLKNSKETDQFKLSIAGNLSFLNNFGNIICNKLLITNKSINSNGAINVLTYGGNNLTKVVGDFLYKDATVYLNRKYNLWREFNDYYNSRKFT